MRPRLTEHAIAYVPPYEWDSLLRFFASHAVPGGLESATGDLYERAFTHAGQLGAVEVRVAPDAHALSVRVWSASPDSEREALRRVRRMFDVDADPHAIARGFAAEPLLARLHSLRPGIRLPRGWDPFETSVCAILGQLVSVQQAGRLIGQLVESYGDQIEHPVSGARVRLFPTARAIADASLDGVGTTGGRKAAIREFARRVDVGVIRFDETQDPAEFKAAIMDVKGLGPWSAEYMSLRALGHADAFPGTDLILKRIVEMHPALDVKALSPWRAYAALHLWREFAGQTPKPVRSPKINKKSGRKK